MTTTLQFPSLGSCTLHSRNRSNGVAAAAVRSAKRSKYAGTREKTSTLIVTVEPDGSDVWRLDAVVDLLKGGAVSWLE